MTSSSFRDQRRSSVSRQRSASAVHGGIMAPVFHRIGSLASMLGHNAGRLHCACARYGGRVKEEHAVNPGSSTAWLAWEARPSECAHPATQTGSARPSGLCRGLFQASSAGRP
jgi:hypothetical protein